VVALTNTDDNPGETDQVIASGHEKSLILEEIVAAA